MQQILNVTTPATATAPAGPYDLVSLEEMKMKFAIPDTNTQWDALIQELITNLSETIAKLCNRVFAFEEVDESFWQLEDASVVPTQRLYLSRWPVKLGDISSISCNGTDILPNLISGPGSVPGSGQGYWILEEETGTLYMPNQFGSWLGTIDVQYGGGYELPDGAPGTLKFAVEALLRESYMSWIRSPGSYGVRLLTHKESRIGYYGPNMFPTLGLPATWTTVQLMLNKYIRHWV
jgi:hypothetical protein